MNFYSQRSHVLSTDKAFCRCEYNDNHYFFLIKQNTFFILFSRARLYSHTKKNMTDDDHTLKRCAAAEANIPSTAFDFRKFTDPSSAYFFCFRTQYNKQSVFGHISIQKLTLGSVMALPTVTRCLCGGSVLFMAPYFANQDNKR